MAKDHSGDDHRQDRDVDRQISGEIGGTKEVEEEGLDKDPDRTVDQEPVIENTRTYSSRAVSHPG